MCIAHGPAFCVHTTLSDLIIELTDEELNVLIQTCDADNDGKIGIEDFRSLSVMLQN